MDEDPAEAPGAEAIRAWTSEARDHAASELAAATNRLWAGNGAGLISSITLMAAASSEAYKHGEGIPAWWFWCPVTFASGLAALGTGSLASILRASRRLHDLEDAAGILDLRMRSVERPSKAVGAVVRDWRTLCNLLATSLLLIGIGLGLANLFTASRPLP